MTYHPITTTLLALGLATSAAHAQHATSFSLFGNDSLTLQIRNDGPTDIVGIELLAGQRGRPGAVFGPGTVGDQSWSHWAGPDRYSITAISLDLQRGEVETAYLNLDGVALGDQPFSAVVSDPWSYVGSRAIVTWADGFEAYIPTSRGLDGGMFDYTDIPPVPDAPTGALALAGLALVATLRSRHAHRD